MTVELPTYRHRQTGRFLVGLAGAVLVVGIVLILVGGAAIATGIVLLVGAAAVGLGSVLTVTVDETHVSAVFLAGWPKHRVALDEISSAARVMNKAWWGLGVRRTPEGWMYNVGGLDAIELELRSGKRLRIGTDRPDDLAAALGSAGVTVR